MSNWGYWFYFVVVSFLLTTSCAKRGFITGGPKDTLAPVVLHAFPENFSTKFDAKTIKITFDEFIKLDNINQHLIISPPMNKTPEILPMGFASKSITIKISDTLHSNTTYSLNFGQSIKDNNEGNPYTGYKYVFSTGDKIDSLKLQTQFKDAYSKINDNFVNVMLYKAETFKDSTIYKEKPVYVSNSLDSLTNVSIDNIKEGSYYLVALKDKNSNYLFNPKDDKIAFYSKPISLPNDSLFLLFLFKEKLPLNVLRPTLVASNKWLIPYQGNPQKLEITARANNKPLDIVVTKVDKKDSLHVFIPKIKYDSIAFVFKDTLYEKTHVVKPRTIKITDSLAVTTNKTGTLHFTDTLALQTTTPVKTIDVSKILLSDKDSLKVDFKIKENSRELKVQLLFDKKEKQSYSLKLFPGAIADFYGKKNDSLQFDFSTQAFADYGNLTLTLKNPKARYPLIVQLLNEQEEVFTSTIVLDNKPLIYNRLPPSKYFVRVIYDENKNNKWDTGNFLKKTQPEKVDYFTEPIELRANWEANEILKIEF